MVQTDPPSRKKVWKVSHVFARSNYDQTEYRLPHSLLKEFISFAEYMGYNPARFKILDEPVIKGTPIQFKLKKEFSTPRPHQKEWIEYQLREGAIKANNANTGLGKDICLTAKIKIPGGWSTMGEMKVGKIITAWDGTPTKVTGVFPQGIKETYKITFEDGRATKAGLGHLWKIYDICGPKTARTVRGREVRTKEEVENNRWRIVTTEELLKLSEDERRWKRIYVPLCKSEDSPPKKLKIPPYLMGVLLGDGCLTGGTVSICKPYQQLFDKIESLLPEHMECRWYREGSSEGTPSTFTVANKERHAPEGNQIRKELRVLGALGKRSWEKVIPYEYLVGSHQQRLELLQGLLDTDGTVGAIGVKRKKSNGRTTSSKGGSISFSSSSKKLSEGVQYLVRSLGGIAKLSTRTPHYTYKGERLEGRTDYRVFIRHPDPNSLFTLEHKKDRAQPTQYSNDLKLRIKSIERIKDRPTQCISIDHPDRLFITDDFIVTHNTYMSLYTMTKLGVRTLITIQPRYITTWLNDIEKTMDGIGKDDILLWEHTDLSKLGDSIKKGKINPKIIILPLTRITGYLRWMKEDPKTKCLSKVFKDMGCGLRIIDEGHESFHEVTMSMFYGNPKKTLLLSATLESDDPVTDKMYRTMIPNNYRLKEAEAENFIDVHAYCYKVCQHKYKIKTKQFGSYSDIAFENSILRSNELKEFYYQLMKKAFNDYYLDRREEKMKCLFFFTLVDMCLYMKERFKQDYPSEDFETYLGTLDKKNPTKYLEHEIIITTPGSCGTGKDIPGLMTVICSHTVFSTQRNKQMIGRLRNPRDMFGGRVHPTFVFPVCLDIQKHRDCVAKRKSAFAKKTREFKNINSFMELA